MTSSPSTPVRRSRSPTKAEEDAAKDFAAEEAALQQYQKEYDAHLDKLRNDSVQRSMNTVTDETLRITQAAAEEDYGGILIDKGLRTDIENRAKRQLDSLFIKIRSVTGLSGQIEEMLTAQDSLAASLCKTVKYLMSTAKSATHAAEQARTDSSARIALLTRIIPTWNVYYQLVMQRAEQWFYNSYIIERLAARVDSASATDKAMRVKQEIDALDMQMPSDDDDDDDSNHSE